MFKQARSDVLGGSRTEQIEFTFDGKPCVGRRGDTVAAALLANGVRSSRTTPVSGAARGPYCMMGVCFECLVVVDGVGNQQGCLIPIAGGMVIETQRGRRQTAPFVEHAE